MWPRRKRHAAACAWRTQPSCTLSLPLVKSDHYRARAPPYASAVIVELYAESDGSNAAIEIRFKNESALFAPNHPGHVLLVPGCTSERCSLSEFKAAVAAVLPGDDLEKVGVLREDGP